MRRKEQFTGFPIGTSHSVLILFTNVSRIEFTVPKCYHALNTSRLQVESSSIPQTVALLFQGCLKPAEMTYWTQ